MSKLYGTEKIANAYMRTTGDVLMQFTIASSQPRLMPVFVARYPSDPVYRSGGSRTDIEIVDSSDQDISATGT